MSGDKEISAFMMDSSEGEGNKEAVMDFEISWMLRMAEDGKCTKRPILCKYCRNFLAMLIDKKLSKGVRVIQVETWKEYRKIDLWVRIMLEENGIHEQHEILIENKVYSILRKKQLQVYRKIFDTELDKNFPLAKRHYVLLTCFESYDDKIYRYAEAGNYGFRVIPWDRMTEAMFEQKQPVYSESDIFNEFWINSWN